jgi:hypothetical protein
MRPGARGSGDPFQIYAGADALVFGSVTLVEPEERAIEISRELIAGSYVVRANREEALPSRRSTTRVERPRNWRRGAPSSPSSPWERRER